MEVKYVNGFLIRNTLDDDFGIIHQPTKEISHFATKFYIPPDEVWLDYCFKNEEKFLLELDNFILLKEPIPNYIIKSEIIDSLKVQDVDGALVRQYLDPEFIFGGHDLVYSDYIPASEIWLDAKMDPAEREFILLHEQVERVLMSQGKSYDVAHEFATVSDKELRRARGVGFYPGDVNYPWRDLGNEEIIKKYYV